jgi:hypothetical protein
MYETTELPVRQYSSKTAQPLKYGKSLAMDWGEKPRPYEGEGAVLLAKKPVA